MSGQDTEPGATFFQVYFSMLEKVHDPIFTRIDLDIDVDGGRVRFKVPELLEARGEPILKRSTGSGSICRTALSTPFARELA
jgi:hypothetical protein